MTVLEPPRPGARGRQQAGAPVTHVPPLAACPDDEVARLAAASFLLEGRHVAIVPRGTMPLPEATVVGSLALEGRAYVVIELHTAPVSDMLDMLSPRELEVALLVAEGGDAKAIARRLRISFYTVRVHLGRIYGKLGLHKQTELTACVAARYGNLRGRLSCGPDA